jgi:uncharacterized protein YlxW (UPF0749 family)
MAPRKPQSPLEKASDALTQWIGTTTSIVAHTLFFIGIFALQWVGVSIDKILLILTTAVSLEAIYLAIFIQMSVNKTSQSLENVEEDIEDIQEDVEDIQEDVDEMQEDVEDLQEDVDEVHIHVEKTDHQLLQTLIKELKELRKEINTLKKK